MPEVGCVPGRGNRVRDCEPQGAQIQELGDVREGPETPATPEREKPPPLTAEWLLSLVGLGDNTIWLSLRERPVWLCAGGRLPWCLGRGRLDEIGWEPGPSLRHLVRQSGQQMIRANPHWHSSAWWMTAELKSEQSHQLSQSHPILAKTDSRGRGSDDLVSLGNALLWSFTGEGTLNLLDPQLPLCLQERNGPFSLINQWNFSPNIPQMLN